MFRSFCSTEAAPKDGACSAVRANVLNTPFTHNRREWSVCGTGGKPLFGYRADDESAREENIMEKAFTLLDLLDAFPDEEACARHLYELRTREGRTCPKCGSPSPSLLLSRRKIQCTRCSHQQALTANTPLYRSHVPLRKWFLAAYLIAADKRGVSACRLSRELGVKWECAYYLLGRLRGAMAESGCLPRP